MAAVKGLVGSVLLRRLRVEGFENLHGFAQTRKRIVVKRLSLTLFACAIGWAYVAEVMFAMNGRLHADREPIWTTDQASPQRKREMVALAAAFGIVMDTRDRNDVVNDLRTRRVDAVPAIRLEEVEASKLATVRRPDVTMIGGISNSLTVLCNESGEYVTYYSDEHGFRNPRGIWRLSHADVAIVGESFAQGDCVPDGKTFPDLMRTVYPATLNLGSSGESALLQLGAIREYLQFYSPRVVLWVFCEGIDLAVLHTQTTQPLLRQYLDENFSQHLIDRQPEIDTALRRYLADTVNEQKRHAADRPERAPWINDGLGIIKLWDLREWLATTYGKGHSGESVISESNVRLFGETLRQARDMAASWGGTLYMVYLPSWDRYKNNSTATDLERTAVLRTVASLQIPLIDVHVAFQKHGDPLSLFPFRRFGHYNEAGYGVVAEAILQKLPAREGSGLTTRQRTESHALARQRRTRSRKKANATNRTSTRT